MTPELKVACEVVFQEHKVSGQPIKWNSDTFRGRISLGLSEMAKATLVKKNIIILTIKAKKEITKINPAVAAAASFEEAEEMVKNKAHVLVATVPDDQPVYIAPQVPDFDNSPSKYSHQLLSITGTSETQVAEIKWYMKPLFYYVVWPLCAVIAGAAVTYLIDFVQTKLFLGPK